MKIQILLLLFTALNCVVTAQPFKERVVAMQKEYGQLTSAHIKISIKVYENKEGGEPLYHEVVAIKRHFENFLYQLSEMEMLLNKKYVLVVDKSSKEMVCTKRSLKGEEKFFADPVKVNMDSLFSLYGTPQLVRDADNVEHYSMVHEKSEIRRVDVFIDKDKNVLKQLEYYYADQHYVIIEFTEFNKAPGFDESTFNEAKYFNVDKGALKASGNFRGYSVVEVD